MNGDSTNQNVKSAFLKGNHIGSLQFRGFTVLLYTSFLYISWWTLHLVFVLASFDDLEKRAVESE